MAFLAQDAEKRFFCYANSELRKDEQNDEILAFVKYWRQRTGSYPEELVFDSKFTMCYVLGTVGRVEGKEAPSGRIAPRLSSIHDPSIR